MARIVLATIGSLGDLHPFIAIGRSLAARGEEVVLAVPEDCAAKTRAAGLEAAPIFPSYAAICAGMNMDPADVAEKVMADTNFIIEQILLPSLGESSRALDDLAAGADILAGSIFAFAADIVAEKRRLPLAAIMLQPMTLFSAWYPPTAPNFEYMRHNPASALGRGWNRLFLSMARNMVRRRHSAAIDAVRLEHGLGPSKRAPILDHGPATASILCCWSRVIGALPPDAPARAALVGFPFFDSQSGADEILAPELSAFLAEGEAPLIFTLGSFAVTSAGHFYGEAVAAARLLGRRALMLTGQSTPPRREGDCLFMGYAPHSLVFRSAAAVIHHGGIGTTGQALRAGRPQIVVPHFGDQFDNAARLEAVGIGVTIQRESFDRQLAAKTIADLLAAPCIRRTAEQAARLIEAEDGAATAARLIAGLKPSPSPVV